MLLPLSKDMATADLRVHHKSNGDVEVFGTRSNGRGYGILVTLTDKEAIRLAEALTTKQPTPDRADGGKAYGS